LLDDASIEITFAFHNGDNAVLKGTRAASWRQLQPTLSPGAGLYGRDSRPPRELLYRRLHRYEEIAVFGHVQRLPILIGESLAFLQELKIPNLAGIAEILEFLRHDRVHFKDVGFNRRRHHIAFDHFQ
jgi:hypothetical protein